MAGDAEINALRFRIEEDCLALIATQQPAAGDLRIVMAAFSIVSDLERMADHAAGIARIVLRMGDEPLLKPLIDMPRMAESLPPDAASSRCRPSSTATRRRPGASPARTT